MGFWEELENTEPEQFFDQLRKYDGPFSKPITDGKFHTSEDYRRSNYLVPIMRSVQLEHYGEFFNCFKTPFLLDLASMGCYQALDEHYYENLDETVHRILIERDVFVNF